MSDKTTYTTNDIIPYDELFGIVRKYLHKDLRKYLLGGFAPSEDEFSCVFDVLCSGTPDWSFEKFHHKFNMAVGYICQAVLGSSTSCFQSTGASNSEGLLDLVPRDGKTSIACEVKKSAKSEKGSAKASTFDRLASAIDSDPNVKTAMYVCVCGLAAELDGTPWRVSKRSTRDDIVVVGGETAFSIAFGREDAFDLFVEAFVRAATDLKRLIEEEIKIDPLASTVFHHTGRFGIAYMRYDAEISKFIVLAGSNVDVVKKHCADKTRLLQQRASANLNVDWIDGRKVWTLIEDMPFDAVSGAASFVMGGMSNGNDFWRDDEGRSFRDYIGGEENRDE